ncbi:alcohol dehydrogenase GroES domain protein (plasmid) [Dinoroseobacter shibae DFL 12 = DSM 16493]|jgi:(R,R)-butanediol dehydrogenase/meso-butanediol dehydrogenase/diacetyl reductase|uniref:Alcohol dehydrogenase GroES domain protein n=1 Tax=Dinoroseobacter shibae (strain DSM 16493 / NCIMB 14021 / DFL 12) TaxID=398580 RepID=A8LUF2_DINSH|nr:2,3-butanediol dehydrogenase [Dinoroseobacter shibae]ABV95869.1 alcohol dehydrogenase GroES domain protein [Dinoroseobacter shibae DFL 12 = DSM 16493]URF49184.1 2,3-butanediol dehydrogenase [Dinoroseobacter shibae]URF53492.1 2,3-butanediol dehydrogenase [Dinoroseobacter shibae]
MKAARWHGAKDIRVEDVDEPTPGAGEVKIKVAWTGICGSDLHEFLAGPIFVPVGEDHPLSHDKAPITMGHEYCGEITELGDGVTDLSVGDRVAIEPIFACGTCAACRDGRYNLCEKLGFVGLSGGHGGFAAYSVVPARMLHRMPEGLSMEQGALVEPAAVALHAVRVSAFKAGDRAAVFGAGPIGLLVVESLRIAGASKIVVVEPSETRRAKAMELGATTAVDPGAEDAVAAVQAACPGGVEVAFEVTGVPAVLAQAIDATRYEGETLVVSIWETEASFQPNTVVLKERNIKGTIAYRNVYPAVMDLMQQGYFQAERLVTRRIGLDDIVRDGFEALVAEKSQIKILVEAP